MVFFSIQNISAFLHVQKLVKHWNWNEWQTQPDIGRFTLIISESISKLLKGLRFILQFEYCSHLILLHCSKHIWTWVEGNWHLWLSLTLSKVLFIKTGNNCFSGWPVCSLTIEIRTHDYQLNVGRIRLYKFIVLKIWFYHHLAVLSLAPVGEGEPHDEVNFGRSKQLTSR